MSSPVINTLSQGARTNSLERIETPAAAITLTRTATLAIVTTGTTITWQSATRNTGFTWSGTDITIPTAGYYALNFSYQSTTNHTAVTRISVAGVFSGVMTSSYVTQVAASGLQTFTHMRYIATGTVIQINVIPSANVTIAVNAENAANESPILHIVQLTRPVL